MNELETFLAQRMSSGALVEGRVSSDALTQLWSELFPDDDYASRQGRAAFLDAVRASAEGDSRSGELEFRPGGWEVNLGKGLAQATVAAALLGGILVTLGVAAVPAAVLTAVVPLLFDVNKTRLTESQQYVLAELVVNPDVREGKLTIEELYALLSPETRDGLSLLEFRDLVETFRRAGLADQHGDARIGLRPADRAKFRVTIK